ncbi:MAG: hypothetical protein NZO58_10300 [Gemmataceae bacterium]|nr:hypothetical protein [Gemmataceae bacterium]
MQIELSCPSCGCRFAAAPHCSTEEVLDQMFETGPRFALGDGATFEDMIFSTIMENGEISCPECGTAVNVSEESLSALAMEMLASW